ncbi:hypothetical protein MAR_029004, partial [Mya arenaria]
FQNESLMKKAFKQIEENAVAMKEETTKLRTGYKDIQQKVSDDYNEAFKVKKEVEKTKAGEKMAGNSDKEEWTPPAAVFTGVKLGTGVSAASGLAYAAGKWIYNYMSNKQNRESNLEEFKAFEKSYKDATGDADGQRQMLEKHRKKTIEQKKEAINNVHKMRAMCSQHVSAGDPRCLLVVQENLCKVDKILTRIIEFWSSMAAVAQDLIENGKTLPEILTDLGPEHMAKMPEEMKTELNGMVQNCILEIEKGWNLVGGICFVYIRDNDIRLQRDYEFLSTPIDQMAQADRRTRESKLLTLMEQEVEKNLCH